MPLPARVHALLVLALLTALPSCSPRAWSQGGRVPTGAAGVASSEKGSRASTSTVALDVVVTQKSGAPIAGLAQPDFTLLDNKVPRAIASFQAIPADQSPAEVTLVIDSVNTSFSIVASERQQIERFLSGNEGALAHPTSLAVFTDAGIQVQPEYTTDGNALRASIEQAQIGLREIRRSTGFWGADERSQLSIDALDRLIARLAARPGHKIVIWVSPGWPLLSGPNIQLGGSQQQNIFNKVVDFSSRLREAQITLYNVNPIGAAESVGRSTYYQSFLKGVAKPSQVDLADLSLQVLATQSGGLVLTGNNDVGASIKRIFTEVGPYYRITFNPPPPDRPNEYHRLGIRLDQPGLTARTNLGFYAQP